MTNKTLEQLYQEHHGKVSDKWSLYLSNYDRFFYDFRDRDINLLEIGIQNGGSLEIWSSYFPHAKKLIGCDINPDCRRLIYKDPRIAVVIGDVNLDETEEAILSHTPTYDLIIDDGSHRSSDIVKTFSRYFPHLTEGGVFVVEDLHCSYWQEFEGGLFDPFSSITFFKRLADILNYEHWGVSRPRQDLLAGFASHYDLSFAEKVLAQIHSIEFINSVCVVRKLPPHDNLSGLRKIVGEEELVQANIKSFNNSEAQALNQSHNIWSVRPLPPEEELIQRLDELMGRDAQLTQLNQTVVALNDQIARLDQSLTAGAGQITSLTQSLVARDDHISSLNQLLLASSGQITSLTQSLVARDSQITGLTQTLVESADQITNLNQSLVERDGKITSLNQSLVESADQITNLSQCVVERDGRISGLTQTLVESADQITTLNQCVVERDGQISGLHQQQSMLNAELLKLNTERSTFGAKTGRGITSIRARIAPVGTRRGSAITLITKLVTSLVVSNWKTTAAKTYRYVTFRMRLRFLREDMTQVTTGTAPEDSVCAHTPGARVLADYPQLSAWMERHEPTPEQLSDQAVAGSAFPYQPLLSVIVPIYKVPRNVLDETLASLERQTYANWQACLVWSDVDDMIGWRWLQVRTKSDTRFKVQLLRENGGISRNSNAAFEMVDGDFIALLDHDDALTPWAFYEIVKRLQTQPQLDFIYSDKDSLTADGAMRLNALFKPEWSPEMLHSVNYLTHLNIIRTKLVREIGGWRSETDGAQDWDLFFRVTEKTQNIARVPSILYHWRILPTSTATGLAAKPYAALGQLKSQQDYFTRRGLSASVIPSPEGMFKVCWPVHSESIDIVIFQNGTITQLVNMLDILRASKLTAIRRIYLIHNTPITAALKAFQSVWHNRIFFTQIETVNWRTALEATLLEDSAESIVLLDGGATGISETLPEELSGWVSQHPDIAWASALALNTDGTVYEAGRVVSADQQSAPMFSGVSLYTFGWFGGPLWYRNARACSPYAVAMKAQDARIALSELDTLDGTRDAFVALCQALTINGRRGLIDPFARVHFNKCPESNWPNDGHLFHTDPYFHPAFDQVNPLRLQA